VAKKSMVVPDTSSAVASNFYPTKIMKRKTLTMCICRITQSWDKRACCWYI